MMNGKPNVWKRLWAVTPPWLIIGAIMVLVPVFSFLTLVNIDRQKEQATRLLVEKGATLIRSFEAGARTGIGLRWGDFQFQKLLMETAEQPDIDYLIVTDAQGTILADSDPLRIGMVYGQDLDLLKIAGSESVAWRQVPNSEGADSFEVYRRFSPTQEPGPGLAGPFQGGGPRGEVIPTEREEASPPGRVIFIGLDMGPINAAHEQDRRHTIWRTI
ncbi:MAG: hypothetical protein PHI99_03165, partial [Syntrophales bacterium]|nr:hypothetical protein [Syntrophales bacterium]